MTDYASLADVYEFLTPEALLSPEGNVASLAPWLPKPPARVLDCACGTGWLAAGLMAAGYEVAAADISPAMVARTRALGVPAQLRSWDDTPPTGDCDVVLCVGNSLTHTSDRRTALRAMAGALKPGGTLIVTSRNWEVEQAAGTEEVERGGRRARVTRTWTPGQPTRLEIVVELADPSQTVRETLTAWPFTAEELLDDLHAAGLEPHESTQSPQAERYLVAATRR